MLNPRSTQEENKTSVVQSSCSPAGWLARAGANPPREDCEETGWYMLEPMKGGLNLSTAQVLRKSGWHMRHTMPGGQDTSNLSVSSFVRHNIGITSN